MLGCWLGLLTCWGTWVHTSDLQWVRSTRARPHGTEPALRLEQRWGPVPWTWTHSATVLSAVTWLRQSPAPGPQPGRVCVCLCACVCVCLSLSPCCLQLTALPPPHWPPCLSQRSARGSAAWFLPPSKPELCLKNVSSDVLCLPVSSPLLFPGVLEAVPSPAPQSPLSWGPALHPSSLPTLGSCRVPTQESLNSFGFSIPWCHRQSPPKLLFCPYFQAFTSYILSYSLAGVPCPSGPFCSGGELLCLQLCRP